MAAASRRRASACRLRAMARRAATYRRSVCCRPRAVAAPASNSPHTHTLTRALGAGRRRLRSCQGQTRPCRCQLHPSQARPAPGPPRARMELAPLPAPAESSPPPSPSQVAPPLPPIRLPRQLRPAGRRHPRRRRRRAAATRPSGPPHPPPRCGPRGVNARSPLPAQRPTTRMACSPASLPRVRAATQSPRRRCRRRHGPAATRAAGAFRAVDETGEMRQTYMLAGPRRYCMWGIRKRRGWRDAGDGCGATAARSTGPGSRQGAAAVRALRLGGSEVRISRDRRQSDQCGMAAAIMRGQCGPSRHTPWEGDSGRHGDGLEVRHSVGDGVV